MREPLPGTALERGRVVPGAPLRDELSHEPVSMWELRGRVAAALCFVHPSCRLCRAFVAELEEREEDVGTAGARVLVVGPGEGAGRFLGDRGFEPLVLVVDRDGAAWRSYPAPGHDFPGSGEVVADLWHLATMCPECGVSTWE